MRGRIPQQPEPRGHHHGGQRGLPRAQQLPLVARFEVPARGNPVGASPRRRDRRGRGVRGPLLPLFAPAYRTRAARFDDLVLDLVAELDRRWGSHLRGAEFGVEDVPPSDPAPWEDEAVPLGRCFPAEAGSPARVVVYRRPIEARAIDVEDLEDLLRDVIVEQVAHLLARSPEEIDPRYGR